jgi:phage regulator Rha-like protein
MCKIVEMSNEEPVVSHRLIAESTDNKEKSILDIITRYKEHFEEFGCILFSDLKSLNKNDDSRGRPAKTYYLNEQQATFLMTLLRNNEKVVEFKLKLVKEFYEMRKKIQEFEIIKQTKELPPNRENLLEMFKPDFKETFERAVGKQRSKAIYKRIESESYHDKTYDYKTGFSKRWVIRGEKLYVQGAVEKGIFRRYSTGLNATDENIKWIDEGNNALDLFCEIHNKKINDQ